MKENEDCEIKCTNCAARPADCEFEGALICETCLGEAMAYGHKHTHDSLGDCQVTLEALGGGWVSYTCPGGVHVSHATGCRDHSVNLVETIKKMQEAKDDETYVDLIFTFTEKHYDTNPLLAVAPFHAGSLLKLTAPTRLVMMSQRGRRERDAPHMEVMRGIALGAGKKMLESWDLALKTLVEEFGFETCREVEDRREDLVRRASRSE